MRQKGFTLIELLIVIVIIGLIFAVTVPVSVRMYNRYMASLEAEKVMLFMFKLQRDSFLDGDEKLVETDTGLITVNGVPQKFSEEFTVKSEGPPPESQSGKTKSNFVYIPTPILFFTNGTTSGGIVMVYVKDFIFAVKITPPYGEIRMKAHNT
ncbi:MAG: prepilin-type N-terminal cleavage/methylation domain-containing protein [Nitrospirae bacterium]|nr:prepilin-type N-terminal cleavage/methylation domain-containing protein [Nitrospirota bacterium]